MECAMRSIGAASESASSRRLSSEQRSSSITDRAAGNEIGVFGKDSVVDACVISRCGDQNS
jgi:hypothetical protein